MNQLEPVIDKILTDFVNENLEDNSYQVFNFTKSIFIKTVYLHDFGKINPNFQIDKMGNDFIPRKDFSIGSDHSILSAYIYLAHLFEKISKSVFSSKDKSFLYSFVIALAHSILKHHGSLNKAIDYEVNEKLCHLLNEIKNRIKSLSFFESEKMINLLNKKDLVENFIQKSKNNFHIFLLVKLNSSLLTASDYLATNHFMLDIPTDDFGVLDDALKKKIIKNTFNISYNSTLLKNFDEYFNISIDGLKDISSKNLNILRQKLSAEVIRKLKANVDERLFYIEAPTGSGKTNLSMLVLAELLKKRKYVNKVFYVFPFTSLITQTYEHFKKELQLNEKEIIQLHSKAPYTQKEEYGSKRKNFIDSLFINYPLIFLSHIKFFDVLTSNEKEENYLLHRLANSVVVLDEMQSYTPSEWDKINYFINNYSSGLNITFILMSATLPKISQLFIDEKSKDEFVYLIPNKNQYFNNPNFQNRVEFKFDYLSGWNFSNENLAEAIWKHSEEYFEDNIEVKSIVEFISKISAQEFFEYVNDSGKFNDYKVIIITGTTLEPRRREIIQYLKGNKKSAKILIVATQVVEAGLDIDMDLGFKDISILDSDEQFAGRINRNALKNKSKVFLFNSHTARRVYSKDIRYIIQRNIDQSKLSNLLITKNFDNYYSLVFDDIRRYNQDQNAENFSSFLTLISNLDFLEVKKRFVLIKNNSVSIFVPLAIPSRHFTKEELKFLNKPEKDNEVNGKLVWNIYEDLILNKEIHFLDKKANIKILSSIMSKYIFSVWKDPNFYQLLKHYGQEEYGFFYLENWRGIYSFENGLKKDLETDCNFI